MEESNREVQVSVDVRSKIRPRESLLHLTTGPLQTSVKHFKGSGRGKKRGLEKKVQNTLTTYKNLAVKRRSSRLQGAARGRLWLQG